MKSYSLQICRVIELLEKSVAVMMTANEKELIAVKLKNPKFNCVHIPTVAIMATTDLKRGGR